MMPTKLAVTALLSLAAGAAGTYVTMHVTATCTAPDVVKDDGSWQRFMSQPAPPITGWKRY